MAGSDNGIFSSVRPRRLSDSAVDQILKLVHDGQLPPGSKFPPERELIVSLSVSRTSLREAIRILETMGVLRVVPGRGTWVREDYTQPRLGTSVEWLPQHVEDVLQLVEMKDLLETKAAGLAAERATPDQLIELSVQLQRYRDAVTEGDAETLMDADMKFHQTIAAASGNRFLADAIANLDPFVLRTRRAILSIPGRPERVVGEHQAVLEAILARNPQAAAKAMQVHDRRAAQGVKPAIEAGRIISRGTPADRTEDA